MLNIVNMVEFEAETKRIGGSLAVLLPRHVVEKEHISERERIVIEVRKHHTAKEFFGLFPEWTTPTQKLKDEMRKGWG